MPCFMNTLPAVCCGLMPTPSMHSSQPLSALGALRVHEGCTYSGAERRTVCDNRACLGWHLELPKDRLVSSCPPFS